MRSFLRKIVYHFPIALTKNIQYDRETKKVMQQWCKADSNCLDIGAHKGEVLDDMIALAPEGAHYAFEPIPDLYRNLKAKYTNCTVLNLALSDKKGFVEFQWVKSNPAYSGLQKRTYDRSNEQVEQIQVETDRLDDVLPENHRVDFIKIDVEGGEYAVLSGAKKTIIKWKPVIVFEHGLGAADCYGISPEMMYNLLVDNYGMSIYTLNGRIKNKRELNKDEFVQLFYQGKEYYFLATY